MTKNYAQVCTRKLKRFTIRCAPAPTPVPCLQEVNSSREPTFICPAWYADVTLIAEIRLCNCFLCKCDFSCWILIDMSFLSQRDTRFLSNRRGKWRLSGCRQVWSVDLSVRTNRLVQWAHQKLTRRPCCG